MALGCDQGHQDDELSAGTTALTVSLANDAGPSAVPANESVVLQWNRFLNPWTVTRQNIRLEGAGGGLVADTVIDYDPVLLRVTLSPPNPTSGWLMVGQNYVIDIPAATPTAGGVQAIDNATLATPTKIEFMAVAPSDGGATPEPAMHFCADVLPVFLGRRCNNGRCHEHPQPGFDLSNDPLLPAQGLALDDSNWVLQTAIGRVSHESNVGQSPVPSAPGPVFGVDMPIIDPGTGGVGDPGNSWLLYKVLLGAPTPASAVPGLAKEGLSTDFECGYDSRQTNLDYAADVPQEISPSERGLLSNFILGREMPYPQNPNVSEMDGGGAASAALTLQEMERVRLWILQGARLDDVVSLPDGGTTCEPYLEGGCNPIRAAAADAAAESGAAPDGATDGSLDGGTKG